MSRVGKRILDIPAGVSISIKKAANGSKLLVVEYKNTSDSLVLSDVINVEIKDGKVTVTPADETTFARSMWGTTLVNINNLIVGLTKGFEITLFIVGIGSRARVDKYPFGDCLFLSLGFSHEIAYKVPVGIEIIAEKPTTTDVQAILKIKGMNKQKVGQIASIIRKLKQPEPYKGKGIKYSDEKVYLKQGKK